MATYTFIPDADLAAERPITTGLMTKLARNPEAIIEGAVGAPRATARIITPGGSAADGPLDDAATPTAPGFYEATLVDITAPKSWPWISLVRVDGDVAISDVVTVRRPIYGTLSQARQEAVLTLLGALWGTDGQQLASSTGGGGGACGAGGNGSPGPALGGDAALAGTAFSDGYRLALARRILVGGNSPVVAGATAAMARGGGCLILSINGDLDCTGGTLDCSGQNGQFISGADDGHGGAGGGSLIVVCNGTITGGTYLAGGGDGVDDTEDGGGGGGGVVALFARAFTGTQTIDVSGGVGPGGATDGAAGVSLGAVTLTEPQINALLLGLTG